LPRKKTAAAPVAAARPEPAEIVGAERARPASYALAISGVALLVRLVHVWQIRRSPFFSLLMGDSRGYDEWARRIAGGEWLGHEVFYQAPLYPYLLGVIYAAAGHHLLVVRVVQALIGSASCALLALAAARLFPQSGRKADARPVRAGDFLRRPAAEIGARRLLRLPRAPSDRDDQRRTR
jgi:hypothetical protein